MPTPPKPTPTRTDAGDDIESRILDAALIQFQKVGVKKSTIEDVAKQAGVDRVTVYRRVGSRDDLVQAVVRREVERLLAELAGLPAQHDDITELITRVFTIVVTRWRAHPLVERLLSVEPERVIMKLTADDNGVFALSVAATAQILADAARRGLFTAPDDLAIRSEIACRVVHSMILVPRGAIEVHTDAELADYAGKYLVPIIIG
ncbi:TetR/AcrR family transcriptional regulator [Nocardia yamanashiensis]|uniref:TetR/AcrR family transcriptional regulator n=1 Tax=Nocardia yamanashiensis TaxID=209247 RepID=UPI00082B4070|nr:TetR/AcrR family transcriptional regulator [Nocardia yamanashiensis]